jgi:hypothetical protein
MGGNSLNAVLRSMGLERFAGNFPPNDTKLNPVKTNLACMRVGLEQPRFLLRKRGCVWTNLPDYGKIPSL